MGYLWQTDELICYDVINPIQYVFHEDTETCTPVYTTYYEDYVQFYKEASNDIKEAKKTLQIKRNPCMSSLFESEKKVYKVDYRGQMSLFDGAKESYVEGTEVEISYSLIATDTNYSFHVDGQEVCVEWNDKKGYIIRFTMPAHDIEVYCVEKNIMRFEPENK